MILFLDFDGVLHPVPTKELFCHVPRLEGVLRDYPEVRVVISSMWRADGLEACRSHFSEDIQPRIIGLTPWVEGRFENSDFIVPVSRYAECLAWIVDNEYTGPWVALDDLHKEFPYDCRELIMCHIDIGFDANVEKQLRHYLAYYRSLTGS